MEQVQESLRIDDLVEATAHYRSSVVVDMARTADGGFVYLMNKEGKLNRSAVSAEDMAQHACPYCTEAIPQAHVGDVADWALTGNKYTSTDREVLSVSQEHSPNLTPTDFRAWMHVSRATGSLVAYSPSRKSVPSHKHAPLFGFAEESPLLNVPVTRLEDSVGITDREQHRAIVLDGDFEARYERTIAILRRLYAREHMFDLVIAPERTYILPSKIIGRALPKKNFMGITSTEDRALFEYITQPDKRDGAHREFDYSECDYTDSELAGLVKRDNLRVPILSELSGHLEKSEADIGGVLTLSEDLAALGYHIGLGLGVTAKSTQLYFATDKRRNFFADCKLPSFEGLEGRDLLVVVDSMTDDIREYILGLKNEYKLNGLRVLTNGNDESFALHFPDDERHQSNNFYVPIDKETLRASNVNSDTKDRIQDIKDICKEDGVFVEMVVVVGPEDAAAIEEISAEFQASSVKIIGSQDISDQQKLSKFISSDVVPNLRKHNPTPQRALSLIGEPQSFLANVPKYEYEEGAIILCLNATTAQEYAASDDFAGLLATRSGKRVYVVANGPM